MWSSAMGRARALVVAGLLIGSLSSTMGCGATGPTMASPASTEPATTTTREPGPMKPLSSGSSPIVVRTDFSDPVAWDTVRDAITAIGTGEEEGFQADVLVVDDPSYEGATLDDVLALVAESYSPRFVMVVDDVTIHGADHPVLVVSLDASGRGETFRAVPASIQAVENNLSIANMDWEDFAGAVDADGIFRGF